MKKITKDILLSVLWILCLVLVVSLQIERLKELWEKWMLISLTIILVLLYMKNVSRVKYYTLNDDFLVIRQIFSKPKQHSMKTVSAWTENQYELLGFKTTCEIVLKTTDGVKINLFKTNSKDFDKLSDYLNENIPEAFEN